jgi:hypothetical protein
MVTPIYIFYLSPITGRVQILAGPELTRQFS